MEKELPKRKPTRLRNFDYSSGGAYFVTICIQDRKRILSEIVKNTNVPVGDVEAPSPTNEMLPRVISAFKKLCNKEIGYNIFQRGYFDHIIRDKEDYETRRKYISENPMRWYYKNM